MYCNKKLTINFHFEPRCNMHCRYCFVPHGKALSHIQQRSIICKIADSNIFDRINFVGGEPTVNPQLAGLLTAARHLGLATSIVTNGFNLVHNPELAAALLPLLDMVGVSVDSLKNRTNMFIGRRHDKTVITSAEYIALCRKITSYGIPLKINTVVSKANILEDFNTFYECVQPDRIKLFQVFVPCAKLKRDYSDMLISEDEFTAFVKRHKKFGARIVAENNEAMTNAYIQLNSQGCFCDNKTGSFSPPLLDSEVTVRKALSYIGFDTEKYRNRYMNKTA